MIESIKANVGLDILIPVYNEEHISDLFQLLQSEVVTPFRVLLCYDSSSDKTLSSFSKEDYNFEIKEVKNQGKGVHSAIMTGFSVSEAYAVVVYPADDILNTNILDSMYNQCISGSDVVVASRFIKGGSMKNCPLLKEILVRLGSLSLYSLSCIPVMDASNGFRLFSNSYLKSVFIESSKGFTYSIELLVKARRLRLNISEIPAQWEERLHGSSRFNISGWIFSYLKWYLYGLATFWLRKGPQTVERIHRI